MDDWQVTNAYGTTIKRSRLPRTFDGEAFDYSASFIDDRVHLKRVHLYSPTGKYGDVLKEHDDAFFSEVDAIHRGDMEASHTMDDLLRSFESMLLEVIYGPE